MVKMSLPIDGVNVLWQTIGVGLNKQFLMQLQNLLLQKRRKNSQGIRDVGYYMKQIPTDPKDIDSIAKERNFSYYQLGLIYKNKFKDYRRSKNKLEAL